MIVHSEFIKLFKLKDFEKIGDDPLMETAFHEAGHALVEILYGFIPKETSIIPDDESLGFNRTFNDYYEYDEKFDPNADLSGEEILKYRSSVLLAGIIAGAYYSGAPNYEGAKSDINQLIDELFSYGIVEISTLQPYIDLTSKLVEKNQELLITIANDLYKYKTLKSDYFKKLIKNKS